MTIKTAHLDPFSRLVVVGFTVGLALGACGAPSASLHCPALADDPSPAQLWIGRNIDALDQHNLPDDTRVIPPGFAVTMDYREDRLNIETDSRGVITKIGCY